MQRYEFSQAEVVINVVQVIIIISFLELTAHHAHAYTNNNTTHAQVSSIGPKTWLKHWVKNLPYNNTMCGLKLYSKSFILLQVNECVQQFREFKNNQRIKPQLIRQLEMRTRTYPLSIAECERGFSMLNRNQRSE